MEIWIPIVIGIVCLAAGFAGGYVYRRNIAEAKIANAEEAVKKMIGDAQKRAETIKKETVLEAKEEAYRIKNENEKELRERDATSCSATSAGCSSARKHWIKRSMV